MSNLVLHCGGYAVDRERVCEVAVPEATASFVPIPHIQAVDLVCRALAENGYHITSEAHGLVGDGARYFGLFEVGSEGDHSSW